MPLFAIETATAHVARASRGPDVEETRILEVEGRGPDARTCRASLVFSPAVDAARTVPVGYVTEASDGSLSIVGWLPEAAYPAYRAALAAGGPLRLQFETRDRGTGYLRRLALARRDATLVATGPGRRGADTGQGQEIAFAMPL